MRIKLLSFALLAVSLQAAPIIVVPVPHQQEEQKPPVLPGCAYQIKVDTDVWKCLTAEQYQAKVKADKEREAQQDKESKDWWKGQSWKWTLGIIAVYLIAKFLDSRGY